MMTLKMTLKDIWEARDMTPEDVASKAGISIGTVWRANRKERLYPKNQRDLCAALGLTKEQYEALDPCPRAPRYRPVEKKEEPEHVDHNADDDV